MVTNSSLPSHRRLRDRFRFQGENESSLYRTLKSSIQRYHTNSGSRSDQNGSVVGRTGATEKHTDDTTKVLSGYATFLNHKPLKMNCKTCALVSSSGRILKQNKGSEIDAADCVLRMNCAPIKGFEDDVGHRTTVRVVSQFSVKNCLSYLQSNLNDPVESFIAWGTENHFSPKSSVHKVLLEAAEKDPKTKYYRVTEEHYWFQDVVFKNVTGQERVKSGSWLTTGWFTFDIIKSACQRTKVYGMIPGDYCRNKNASPAPYHYWIKGGDECGYYRAMENRIRAAHRFMSEKIVFAKWAVKHNISFHAPDWDPSDYSRTPIKFPTPNS